MKKKPINGRTYQGNWDFFTWLFHPYEWSYGPQPENSSRLPSWRFPQGAGFANLFDPAKAAQVNPVLGFETSWFGWSFHAGVGVGSWLFGINFTTKHCMVIFQKMMTLKNSALFQGSDAQGI